MLYKILLICLLLLASYKIVIAQDTPLTGQNNLFNKIALCESGNDAHAKSKTSSATGRFQFLWSTWNHYGRELWGEDFYSKNIWDYNDNTELAWYVFTKYGTGDWDASKNCWSSSLN